MVPAAGFNPVEQTMKCFLQFDSETGLDSLIRALVVGKIEYFCSKAVTHLKLAWCPQIIVMANNTPVGAEAKCRSILLMAIYRLLF